MITLPQRTLYNKRIPKNKFYEKLDANTKLKEKFVEQIDSITWKYKLSKDTINIEPTGAVEEIQVFEVVLRQKSVSKDILQNIDRAIPYPILYILKFDGQAKLSIAYKARNKSDDSKATVDSYCESEWMAYEDISMDLTSGRNLQAIYENIIKTLLKVDVGENEAVDEAVGRQKAIDKLIQEIARLEAKVKTEKQFNKKVELNIELQKKKKELMDITQK